MAPDIAKATALVRSGRLADRRSRPACQVSHSRPEVA